MKFQIGDRVVLISESADFNCGGNEELPRGSTGTVCDVDGNRIGVDWDGYNKGHDCAGRLQGRSGWYVDDDELELVFKVDEDSSVDISALL